MRLCDSYNKKSKNQKKSNKGKQQYCAPIKENLYNDNTNNFNSTKNTISQASFNDFKKQKPSPLYKYSGTYYKKGEQISLMTLSLHDIHGNSLFTNKEKNSQVNKTKNNNSIYNSCIDEDENESSSNDVLEIIYDGKMDETMVEKSTDRTTIDNYNEFIGNNNKIPKKNKIDIYNNKKSFKKNSNNNSKKIENNKDSESNISRIPSASSPFNNLKFCKKSNFCKNFDEK